MNLTLSVDERVVEEAREVARQQGTSLNALVREYLERLAGRRNAGSTVSELKSLWSDGGGRSDGAWERDDLYSDRENPRG
jgi:Family of unknown function (DUF6364)